MATKAVVVPSSGGGGQERGDKRGGYHSETVAKVAAVRPAYALEQVFLLLASLRRLAGYVNPSMGKPTRP